MAGTDSIKKVINWVFIHFLQIEPHFFSGVFIFNQERIPGHASRRQRGHGQKIHSRDKSLFVSHAAESGTGPGVSCLMFVRVPAAVGPFLRPESDRPKQDHRRQNEQRFFHESAGR